ncbi:hypothetical protein NKI38_19525 [Mesorhizobium sp. M0621]|uniref:hypothetical protein n=1 Tax=Mesorhizobium sp. M0621 TaxID=2956974 RepID=UPI00333A09F5
MRVDPFDHRSRGIEIDLKLVAEASACLVASVPIPIPVYDVDRTAESLRLRPVLRRLVWQPYQDRRE